MPVSLTSTTRVAAFVGASADANLVLVGVPLRDGLRGVDEQVQEHLAEARLVRVDGGHVGEALHETRAMADLVPRHLHRALDDAAHVDRAAVLDVALREGQKIADDLPHPVRALDGLLERQSPAPPALRCPRAAELLDRVVAGARRAQAAKHVLEVDQQVRERIVDLVRDARREGPQRGHPVALHELMLELGPLGHVSRDDEHRGRSLEVDRRRHGLGRPLAPALAAPAQAERLMGGVRRGRHDA